MQAVERLVAEQYLPGAEVRCTLLRSYINDVYHAGTDDRGVIVKVYGAGWRSDGELRYEIDLLEHLAGAGVPVARTIPGRDGARLHYLETPDGRRQALVFEVAPGGSRPGRSPRTCIARSARRQRGCTRRSTGSRARIHASARTPST